MSGGIGRLLTLAKDDQNASQSYQQVPNGVRTPKKTSVIPHHRKSSILFIDAEDGRHEVKSMRSMRDDDSDAEISSNVVQPVQRSRRLETRRIDSYETINNTIRSQLFEESYVIIPENKITGAIPDGGIRVKKPSIIILQQHSSILVMDADNEDDIRDIAARSLQSIRDAGYRCESESNSNMVQPFQRARRIEMPRIDSRHAEDNSMQRTSMRESYATLPENGMPERVPDGGRLSKKPSVTPLKRHSSILLIEAEDEKRERASSDTSRHNTTVGSMRSMRDENYRRDAELISNIVQPLQRPRRMERSTDSNIVQNFRQPNAMLRENRISGRDVAQLAHPRYSEHSQHERDEERSYSGFDEEVHENRIREVAPLARPRYFKNSVNKRHEPRGDYSVNYEANDNGMSGRDVVPLARPRYSRNSEYKRDDYYDANDTRKSERDRESFARSRHSNNYNYDRGQPRDYFDGNDNGMPERKIAPLARPRYSKNFGYKRDDYDVNYESNDIRSSEREVAPIARHRHPENSNYKRAEPRDCYGFDDECDNGIEVAPPVRSRHSKNSNFNRMEQRDYYDVDDEVHEPPPPPARARAYYRPPSPVHTYSNYAEPIMTQRNPNMRSRRPPTPNDSSNESAGSDFDMSTPVVNLASSKPVVEKTVEDTVNESNEIKPQPLPEPVPIKRQSKSGYTQANFIVSSDESEEENPPSTASIDSKTMKLPSPVNSVAQSYFADFDADTRESFWTAKQPSEEANLADELQDLDLDLDELVIPVDSFNNASTRSDVADLNKTPTPQSSAVEDSIKPLFMMAQPKFNEGDEFDLDFVLPKAEDKIEPIFKIQAPKYDDTEFDLSSFMPQKSSDANVDFSDSGDDDLFKRRGKGRAQRAIMNQTK